MKKSFVIFLQAIFLITSISCSKWGETGLKGKLLYSCNTTHLYRLDLSSLNEDIIYQENDFYFICYLTSVSNQKIVFSGKQPGSTYVLRLLDLLDNKVKTLREGFSSTYMAKHNVLFFYVRHEPFTFKDSMDLYVGKLDSLENSTLICQLGKPAIGSYSINETPVVQISEDKIVFHGINNMIYEYDYSTGEISETGLRNLYPIAWREKTGELICGDLKGEDFFLANLPNKKVQPINLGKETMGWTYIKEYDILLYSQKIIEWGIIYSYNFSNTKNERLKFNATIMSNAIYMSK